MSNPQTIKIGVVGVGYLGEFHVQQLLTLPHVSVLGITDLDPKRGKIISEKYKELEMLPKHGDVLYLRDIVKRMKGFEILKCNADLLEIIINEKIKKF